MINSKLKQLLLVAGEAVVIAGITILAVAPVSCKITEQGVKILGGDYLPPVLNDFVLLDEKTLQLEFSEKVEVTGYVAAKVTDELFDSEEHSQTFDLSPAIERASGSYGYVASNVTQDESGCLVKVSFEEEMEIGQAYEFYAEVRDFTGNSLTLALPFAGFNSRVPELMITEVQTETASQRSSEKKDGTYRNEYVELLVLKEGNLAGLELCSAYDGEAKKYSFPPIDVKKGEIFVVHMRNHGNGCISESDEDLSLAWAPYTNPEIRDLWTDIETTTLGNKTDIIIIRNRADKRLLDAFMFRAGNIEEWTKTMLEYSCLIDESGIYESGDIENAFVTDGLTGVKTLSRKDAGQIRQRLLDGEALEFPLPSSADLWEILAEGDPGRL